MTARTRSRTQFVTGFRRHTPLLVLAALVLPLVGCASDEAPDVENPEGPRVPFDVTVDEGVDTNVEQPGNLGFDTDQPGFDTDD